MKYTKIKIFDFDATLVDTPLPEVGKPIWKEKTGTDWPHVGWWGRVESLDMDVFDMPAVPEVIDDYNRVSKEEGVLMVMLTGRRAKRNIEDAVRKILDSHGLTFDRYYHNGGAETGDNKIYRMGKLLEEFPDVIDIEFWDDRTNHIPRFQEWGDGMVKSGRLEKFTMNHVLGGHH